MNNFKSRTIRSAAGLFLAGAALAGVAGSAGAAPSAEPAAQQASALFLSPVNPEMRIWSAELRVVTADTAAARADGASKVMLNDMNSTWLDSPLDDFERADDHTWALNLSGVHKAKDINGIKILRNKAGEWCISRLELRLNNALAFSRTYGNSGTCISDANPSLEISSAALRTNAEWLTYDGKALPTGITAASTVGRVEAVTGDQIYLDGYPYYWDGDNYQGAPVVVSKANLPGSAQRITIDLTKAPAPNGRAAVVVLNMHWSCVNGHLNVQREVVRSQMNPADWDYAEKLAQRIQTNLNLSFGDLTTPFGAPFCPTPTVDLAGNVRFG
ncbi:MAG: hypothetical protein ACKVWR_03070 [Acidimicrobiales bacterium]